jgi:hypothetical protein
MPARPALVPLVLSALLTLSPIAAAAASAPPGGDAPPAPSPYLGFTVGADRTLADYGQISRYFVALDRASERVRVDTIGRTTLGRPMLMAVISSAANVRDADHWRDVTRHLADPRGLAAEEAERLVREGKVILLVTCSIHSTEIGASQMAMEWAHDLATTNDPRRTRWLDDVILLLVPSLNPDGTDIVVDWYRKSLGKPYEGIRLPWLYHPYAGHDDNRDWFMLDLAETRNVTRVLHHDWFPQVFLDEHQMGGTGPRIFVPPYADPQTSLVHPLQWRISDLVGMDMALRLEQAGKAGVIHSYQFDAYWPGGTKNTACLKNVVGLLTEVASCRIATPVFVDPGELAGGAKGLPDYKPQANFPNPWKGGWWRLRDVMDYEAIASNSLLETCSVHREDILRAFLEMGRDAVRRGTTEAPYAYAIPPAQRDPAAALQMIAILRENGLEARLAESEIALADGRRLPTGTVVFLAAQPYRPFLLEMMERQRYPEVRQSPDTKEIFKPYDVTAWTLPLMMGVGWTRVDAPFAGELTVLTGPPGDPAWLPGDRHAGFWPVTVLPGASAASVRGVNFALAHGGHVERALEPFTAQGRSFAAGDWLVTGPFEPPGGPEVTHWDLRTLPDVRRAPVKAPRIGLYKAWMPEEDEGWTRFVLDQYGFAYASLDNEAMRAKDLGQRCDVIVLPDMPRDLLVDGRRKPEMGAAAYFESLPAPYAGGIGREGIARLKAFVEQGGTLVCLSGSCALPLEDFNLPVRDLVARAKPEDFAVPGTLVNLEIDPAHPLGLGLPEHAVAYCTGGPVFATTPPGAGTGRSVVARYPQYADQVVASGWARGQEAMAGRAAIVEADLGRGRVVLFGPRVQHRAQMVGTYELLFNALYLGTMGPPVAPGAALAK